MPRVLSEERPLIAQNNVLLRLRVYSKMAAAKQLAKAINKPTRFHGKPPRVGILVAAYNKRLLENGASSRDLRLNFAGDPSFLSATFDEAKYQQVLRLLRKFCLDDTDAVRNIVRKFPGIFSQDPARLRRTAECLQGLGLDVKKLVSNPKVLCMDGIKAKVELLLSHGISAKWLSSKAGHFLLTSDFKEDLKPKLEKLAELSIQGQFLERLLTKCSSVLDSQNISVEASASAFKEAGIEGEDFARMVSWTPLAIKAAGSLTARAEFLIQAGVEKDSNVFISALGVVSALNHASLKGRLERFSLYGFSNLEVQEMIQKQPRILLVSDKTLDKKMSFLQRCVKLPKSNLLSSPNYLIYSLEKRLIPRFHVATSLRCCGLMRGRHSWKHTFYDTDAIFRERVAMLHPHALMVLDNK